MTWLVILSFNSILPYALWITWWITWKERSWSHILHRRESRDKSPRKGIIRWTHSVLIGWSNIILTTYSYSVIPSPFGRATTFLYFPPLIMPALICSFSVFSRSCLPYLLPNLFKSPHPSCTLYTLRDPHKRLYTKMVVPMHAFGTLDSAFPSTAGAEFARYAGFQIVSAAETMLLL